MEVLSELQNRRFTEFVRFLYLSQGTEEKKELGEINIPFFLGFYSFRRKSPN